MKLTSTITLALTGMVLVASKKLDRESMMRDMKMVHYTNLYQYTQELSAKVYATKEKLVTKCVFS